MIVYFSGTGNSRYAAERLAEALGEPLCSLNERIRAHDISPLETGENLIVVTPTYAWQIPHIVRGHLRRTELRGAKRAWFVMTCGDDTGSADVYNRRLCAEKRLHAMGTLPLVMPENYIAMFNAPDTETARQIVARAEPDINRAADTIRAGLAFSAVPGGLRGRMLSGPVNAVFYRHSVRADAFAAGDACTGCGKCAALCPLNNIALQNGKPVWGKDCTHCMACICYCPTETIEYGKKSLGKPRYHFEALK